MTSTGSKDRIAQIGTRSPVCPSDINMSAFVSVAVVCVLACNGVFAQTSAIGIVKRSALVLGGLEKFQGIRNIMLKGCGQWARQRCTDELAKGNYFPGRPVQTERF